MIRKVQGLATGCGLRELRVCLCTLSIILACIGKFSKSLDQNEMQLRVFPEPRIPIIIAFEVKGSTHTYALNPAALKP